MAAGSSPIAVYTKDPAAVLDYTIDWGPWLGPNDAISTATWTFPGGLANSGEVKSKTTATVFVSGGTDGTSYSIYVVIVTTGGRTDKRTLKFNVVER